MKVATLQAVFSLRLIDIYAQNVQFSEQALTSIVVTFSIPL